MNADEIVRAARGLCARSLTGLNKYHGCISTKSSKHGEGVYDAIIERLYRHEHGIVPELCDLIESLQADHESYQQVKEALQREGYSDIETMISQYKQVMIAANEHDLDRGEEVERLEAQLADYEDTGLEPEEIKQMCALARLNSNIFDNDFGNHIAELIVAEQDGRLLVLPCKVGDTVCAIADCADILKDCDDDYYTGTGAITCPFEKDCDFEECGKYKTAHLGNCDGCRWKG